MRTSARLRAAVLATSLLVLGYVGLGAMLGRAAGEGAYGPLSVFSEVLTRIEREYVEDPDVHRVTVGALRGMLQALDPHSSYLSPREYADYLERLKSPPQGDVGLVLSKTFGLVSVITTLPDSPAAQADLRTGDIMESIAGFSTREMSVEQAYFLLAGDPGSTVELAVVRRARVEPQPVELVRARIRPTRVVSGRLEGDIGYMKIAGFPEGKSKEVRRALERLEAQGVRRLLLDLRNSATGSIEEGVATARLFLSEGTITYAEGQQYPRQQFEARVGEAVWTHPMTVLINGGTAGAAEIVAVAIRDNERGKLVGHRSYGVASVQKLIPLDDGSAVVLPVAKYYSPKGASLPDNAVTPNVTVQLQDEEVAAAFGPRVHAMPAPGDPVLLKALEVIRSEPVVEPVRKAAA